MYVIIFHILLISESLCIQYLPNDTIINMPTTSDNGFIYVKDTDWPKSYPLLFFLELPVVKWILKLYMNLLIFTQFQIILILQLVLLTVII